MAIRFTYLHKVLMILAAMFVGLLFCFPHALFADSDAYTRSGGIWVKPVDEHEWNPVTPKPSDSIKFVDGTNHADASVAAETQVTNESKFRFVSQYPSPKAFEMMNKFLRSDEGTWVRTLGSGRSTVDIGFKTTYSAKWRNQVLGGLGEGNALSWKGRSRGHDPFHLEQADFTDQGIQSQFDLLVPFGIEGGTSIEPDTGRVQWDVFYDTADASHCLLNVLVSSEGIEFSSEANDLQFFLIEGIGVSPEQSQSAVTLDELKALLETDLLDNRIDSPLYIGIVWEDVPVPTVELGNGAVAKVRVESDVEDSGSAQTVSFQQGVDEYQGLLDLVIGRDILGGDGNLLGFENESVGLSGLYGNESDRQMLLHFSGLEDQIPEQARIVGASLHLQTHLDAQPAPGLYAVSRLLVPFTEDTTYNDTGGMYFSHGNSARPLANGFIEMQPGEFTGADVTQIVQQWVEGEPNFGMVVSSGNHVPWQLYSSGVGQMGLEDPFIGPVIDVTMEIPPALRAVSPVTVNLPSTPQWDLYVIDPATSQYEDGNQGNPLGKFIHGGQNERQLFVRPSQVFESQGGMVPDNAIILDARLLLNTAPSDLGDQVGTRADYFAKPILSPWDPGTPMEQIQMGPPLDFAFGMVADSQASFDVTPVLQAWQSGQPVNGFCITSPGHADEWGVRTVAGVDGPRLLIKYLHRAETVIADSLKVLHGILAEGGEATLGQSDNVDLSIQRSAVDLQSRTCFELTGISPFATPSAMTIVFENSVFARREVIQSLEIWDYQSNEWKMMDERAAQRFQDSSISVVVSGDLARFVEPGTQEIKSRITMNSASRRQRFSSNTDYFAWIIE